MVYSTLSNTTRYPVCKIMIVSGYTVNCIIFMHVCDCVATRILITCMVEFCINCALNSPFRFIWLYLHVTPHIWHTKPICDVNEEKIFKIAIFDILVVLWAYYCQWQLPADWKIKNFCCHTKTLWSIITLSNVAVSFTIIRACVYQIWGLGCKWFKSYDRKRDFTLFLKLTGSFCTAVLRKIRLSDMLLACELRWVIFWNCKYKSPYICRWDSDHKNDLELS